MSRLKRNGKPVLRLDSVAHEHLLPPVTSAWTRGRTARSHTADWMPRPRVATAQDYAKVQRVPAAPVTAYVACTSLFSKLPAFGDARPADRGPRARGAGGGRSSKPPEGEGGEGGSVAGLGSPSPFSATALAGPGSCYGVWLWLGGGCNGAQRRLGGKNARHAAQQCRGGGKLSCRRSRLQGGGGGDADNADTKQVSAGAGPGRALSTLAP